MPGFMFFTVSNAFTVLQFLLQLIADAKKSWFILRF